MNAQPYQYDRTRSDQATICRLERQLEAYRCELDQLESELPSFDGTDLTTEYEAGFVAGQEAVIQRLRMKLQERNDGKT